MKETVSKVKRQPSVWEKIIENKATDKELISKIHKQFMKLNTRKINKSNNLTDISLKNICRWLTNT